MADKSPCSIWLLWHWWPILFNIGYNRDIQNDWRYTPYYQRIAIGRNGCDTLETWNSGGGINISRMSLTHTHSSRGIFYSKLRHSAVGKIGGFIKRIRQIIGLLASNSSGFYMNKSRAAGFQLLQKSLLQLDSSCFKNLSCSWIRNYASAHAHWPRRNSILTINTIGLCELWPNGLSSLSFDMDVWESQVRSPDQDLVFCFCF